MQNYLLIFAIPTLLFWYVFPAEDSFVYIYTKFTLCIIPINTFAVRTEYNENDDSRIAIIKSVLACKHAKVVKAFILSLTYPSIVCALSFSFACFLNTFYL